jgi:glycosyltransferase involved in cell wall biosynthesis
MAGGVPTVATKAGGTAEILEGPLRDYLVDLHDVAGMTTLLNRLLENPSLRLHVGQLARDRVQTHFSIPAMTDSIRTILLAAR